MAQVNVTDNPDQQRYEAHVEDALAGILDYRVSGSVVELPHTKVDPAFEGQGVGSALVKYALDDIAAGDRSVVPSCPFVAAWIDRHPDYRGLVAERG